MEVANHLRGTLLTGDKLRAFYLVDKTFPMSNKKAKELRIATLLDGRPGHEKQTMGIVRALRERVDVEVIAIHIEPSIIFKELLNTCFLYLPGKHPEQPDICNANLLIGTGRKTHLPLLLYKKRYSIPAVTCMNPAGHLRSQFDLCFVPVHDGKKEKDNIVLTFGSPSLSIDKKRHQPDHGLILLGGLDVKSHHWDGREVSRMIEKLVCQETETVWTASSSPRTPLTTIDIVKDLAEKYPHLTFFDFKDTPSGWVEEQYDKCEVVWVTSDSISMIYEALSAGCKVGIFPMQWIKKDSKFGRNESILLEKGQVKSFAAWEQGDRLWANNIVLNEAQRCADRILHKWWPENLQ